MLTPSPDWFWTFDHKHNCLFLDMGEMVFCAALKSTKLNQTAYQDQAFSVDDTRLYDHFFHNLQDQLELAEPVAVQVALNAIASHRFSKITGAQSWFFEHNTQAPPGLLDTLVTIESQSQRGLFLIIEKDLNNSHVMLLNSEMQLNGGKCIHQFDSLYVGNERLSAYHQTKQVSQQQAGY